MYIYFIYANFVASVSFALNNSNASDALFINDEKPTQTTLDYLLFKVFNETKPLGKMMSDFESPSVKQSNATVNELKNSSNQVNDETTRKAGNISEHTQRFSDEHNNLPFIRRLHARITHSKDAVWATISLTFVCVLLVLAVAQSRMWKDHYHAESQGVPLPNFNERVLFKDVMDRKVKSLKEFFKKKSKQKNFTELESLLPPSPSDWDV